MTGTAPSAKIMPSDQSSKWPAVTSSARTGPTQSCRPEAPKDLRDIKYRTRERPAAWPWPVVPKSGTGSTKRRCQGREGAHGGSLWKEGDDGGATWCGMARGRGRIRGSTIQTYRRSTYILGCSAVEVLGIAVQYMLSSSLCCCCRRREVGESLSPGYL